MREAWSLRHHDFEVNQLYLHDVLHGSAKQSTSSPGTAPEKLLNSATTEASKQVLSKFQLDKRLARRKLTLCTGSGVASCGARSQPTAANSGHRASLAGVRSHVVTSVYNMQFWDQTWLLGQNSHTLHIPMHTTQTL